MAYEFSFDSNICTGCHACSVACIIENQVSIENNWRQIVSFNANHHPQFPTFHLSLACNHCDDPPCLKYCPALAYSKDIQTGSVVLNSDFCIGCKYCTWVCPYDAPKFNRKTGTVEKCTFCLHRLQKSKEPACVALCPTDALNIRERTLDNKNQSRVPGFRDYNISPGIDIIPLNPDRQQPEMFSSEYVEAEILELFKTQQINKQPKMNIKNEWTLLVLSIIFPLLIGLTALILTLKYNDTFIPLIIGCGIISFGLSTLHLGNIKKAYRAVLNIKNSWLSREILFVSLFLSSLAVQYLIKPDAFEIKIVTLLFGILALISMDNVYAVIPKRKPGRFYSAIVLLTAIYWYGILSSNLYLIGILGGIRIFLYLSEIHQNLYTVPIRLACGYIVPILLLLTEANEIQNIIFISVLIGEMIDRYEFFKSIDIITPLRQMQMDEELNFNSHSLHVIKTTL